MTAVTVGFNYTWITDPVTGQSVSGPNPRREGSLLLGGSSGGAFRSYAGGRTRVITTLGDSRSTPLTLQSLTDAQLTLLDQWRGKVTLLRDASGWRKWGSFTDLKWNDVPGPSGMIHDVTLTFIEVTYQEGV